MRLSLEIEAHNERYYQKDAPTVSDAAYDALASAAGGDRGEVSRSRHDGFAVAEGRRRAGARLCKSAACRSHAVARQRLQRRGCHRVRRSHPAVSQARCRAYSGAGRRTEDRRPVAVAALRKRRAGPRGDPRRRLYRRGRHRQRPHHQGHSAQAEGPQYSGGLRNARRSLHAQEGFSRAEQEAGGSRRHGVRQSAQFGGGFAAPEGRLDHRVAAAEILRLYLGRDERASGRYAARHAGVDGQGRLCRQSA